MLARTIALLTVALIGGCGGPAAEAPAGASCFASADLLATEDQDNGMVPLYPGQALEVRLRGNSTIYPPLEWSLAAAPPHLRLEGRQIVSEVPGAAGAGAVWKFCLRAVGEGEGRVEFAGGASGRRIGFAVVSDNEMTID